MRLPNISMKGYLLIAALLQIVWGFVPSASQLVINEIPVELYIAIRWSISGVIFAIYLFITKSWKKVSFKESLSVAALGIIGYCIASFGTLYALKLGGVTNYALMGALSPAITSLTAILVLKEKPSRIFYLALPISILGLCLLVTGKYQVSSFQIAGASAVLIVVAYFLEALVFVFSKKFKAHMSAAQYLAIAQLATAVFMWSLQGIAFQQLSSLQNMTVVGISAAIFVSIVACVLCYAILYWLLNHIEGHRLALFDSFHTLSATFFGIVLFHEEMGTLMIVGGALILFGLVAGNLPKGFTEDAL